MEGAGSDGVPEPNEGSETSTVTGVTIPNGVTSIGDDAFEGCSSLTAFTVAESNTAYSARDGILYNKAKTTIVRLPPTKSGALTLPNADQHWAQRFH
jgi:hypothetical protein